MFKKYTFSVIDPLTDEKATAWFFTAKGCNQYAYDLMLRLQGLGSSMGVPVVMKVTEYVNRQNPHCVLSLKAVEGDWKDV